MMIITGMLKAQMKKVSYRNQQLREGGREGGKGGRREEGRVIDGVNTGHAREVHYSRLFTAIVWSVVKGKPEGDCHTHVQQRQT